jgi:acetyl-CoA carboxylase carboxyl transferase subunit beta
MAWFKKTRKPIKATQKESRVPEGLWVKCPSCGRAIYNKELVENHRVCEKCSHHFRMSALERLTLFFDRGQWTEYDAGLRSLDPLKFTDTKPYKTRLEASIQASGMNDAIIVGSGTVEDIPTVIAAMEYSFIGGSMGVVVGEKITRGAELALSMGAPFIVVSSSGGARMMEGALSLMQMAKISAALGRLDRAGLPYLSILTDPTTGGVTASFAMLGDLNIAEPKALIGFAGPRVIEQTIKQKLPEGFQRSEFLLEKGFLDLVVDRRELKATVARSFRVMMGLPQRVATKAAPPAAAAPAPVPAEAKT